MTSKRLKWLFQGLDWQWQFKLGWSNEYHGGWDFDRRYVYLGFCTLEWVRDIDTIETSDLPPPMGA